MEDFSASLRQNSLKNRVTNALWELFSNYSEAAVENAGA
jgi:hypothetical protein